MFDNEKLDPHITSPKSSQLTLYDLGDEIRKLYRREVTQCFAAKKKLHNTYILITQINSKRSNFLYVYVKKNSIIIPKKKH